MSNTSLVGWVKIVITLLVVVATLVAICLGDSKSAAVVMAGLVPINGILGGVGNLLSADEGNK